MASAKVSLIPGIWTAKTTEHLSDLCSVAPGGVAAVERSWNADEVSLWAVVVDGVICGHVVWRFDYVETVKDLVVLWAWADAPGLDLTFSCLPAIEAFAVGQACQRVRFHSSRLGLLAKARGAGYSAPEFIMYKDVG